MGVLERPRGCDIIKPICERPFIRVYACMCVWCHSLAPAPFIFARPQARKTAFWHQRPQASAHAPGTKVSLILPLSPPAPPRLCRHGCLLTVSIPTPFHSIIRCVWLLQLKAPPRILYLSSPCFMLQLIYGLEHSSAQTVAGGVRFETNSTPSSF